MATQLNNKHFGVCPNTSTPKQCIEMDITTPSRFLLNAIGQLEWVELPEAYEQVYCHVELVIGPDWKQIGGLEAIVSQSVVPGSNSRLIYNLPIEILLESTNPFGWPQIVVTCYSGAKCMGIGRMFLPLKNSKAPLKCVLARPCHTSLLTRLFDKRPSIRDSKLLSNPHLTHYLGPLPDNQPDSRTFTLQCFGWNHAASLVSP